MKTRKDVLRPIRRLVRAQCASNHSSTKCHLCPGEQSRCSFFREDGHYPELLAAGNVRCSYFEKFVLPNDPKLEAAYWGKRFEGVKTQQKACDRCGELFTKSNNRHRYCPGCKSIIARQNSRERQRRSRQGKQPPSVTL